LIEEKRRNFQKQIETKVMQQMIWGRNLNEAMLRITGKRVKIFEKFT